MRRPSQTLVRGAISGIIGGLALALWFLILDLIQRQPFRAPSLIISALLDRSDVQAASGQIALYTIIHFAVFILVGILVTWLMEWSATPPHFLLGMVLGFLMFDLVFYGGVIVTGIDVVRELGWPEVLVGNLIAGIALMAYLHVTQPGPVVSWREALREHRVVREGLIAGLIGAVAVAVWFLAIDLIEGRLWFTPAALGSTIFLGARGVAEVTISAPIIIGYTVIHLAAFLVSGFIASALVSAAEKNPPMLLGLILLFVTFEVLFVGLIAIQASWLLNAIAWWMILAGNLIAAGAMGFYLWREHPSLKDDLSKPLEEEEYAA